MSAMIVVISARWRQSHRLRRATTEPFVKLSQSLRNIPRASYADDPGLAVFGRSKPYSDRHDRCDPLGLSEYAGVTRGEDSMARVNEFRVLVGSDGSLSATAATVTANSFPWPAGTRAYGVVSREAGTNKESNALKNALEQAVRSTAETTANALVGRWSGVRVRVADGPPAAAIIRAARQARADVIVMGWRGHGAVRRLLTGSVSPGRRPRCAMLGARRKAGDARRQHSGYRSRLF